MHTPTHAADNPKEVANGLMAVSQREQKRIIRACAYAKSGSYIVTRKYEGIHRLRYTRTTQLKPLEKALSLSDHVIHPSHMTLPQFSMISGVE